MNSVLSRGVWDNLFRGFKLKLFSIIKLYFRVMLAKGIRGDLMKLHKHNEGRSNRIESA